MENDAQLRTRFLLFRQPFEEQAPVVEGVAGQNDFILSLLKKRLDHRVGIGSGNSWNVWPGDHEIGYQ